MLSINLYKAQSDFLLKSLCKLIEKCYETGQKTFILAVNEEYVMEVDKVLWTYSQKYFLPHATCRDEMLDEHPILISDSITQLGRREILVLLNPSTESLLQVLPCIKRDNIITKILIIIPDYHQDVVFSNPYEKIKSLIHTSGLDCSNLRCFSQNDKGQWCPE